LSSIQRQEDITPEKEASSEDMADSPPKKGEPAVVDLSQGIDERAREILQQNAEVQNVDDSQKENEAAGQEKMLEEVISHEKEEKITQEASKIAATTEDELQKFDSASVAVVQNVEVPPADQLQKVDEVEENTEEKA